MARTGLVALVTGSSSGFGELIAHTLARRGHQVYASMRDVAGRNAGPAQAMERLARDKGLQLSALELDVTNEASIKAAVATVLAQAARIDIVVNNAGISAAGPIEAFSLQQVRDIFDVNAFGPLRVNKAVLPAMRAQRSGLIIHISSTLGRVLPGAGGLYPATKWALEGLAESLSYQVTPFGIDVVILEPGAFPSPSISKATMAADQDVTQQYAEAASRAARPPVQPGPDYREPDPQEVADAVAALVDLPAGERPLRSVVGPIFTEGVPEYNEAYERTKAHLREVLRRPDQAVTWGRPRP